MLETEFGMRVSSMWLGQVHPCLARAKLIQVPSMQEELELIVEDQIHRGDAFSGALPDVMFALPQSKICAPNVLDRAHLRRHPISVSWLLFMSLSCPTNLVCSELPRLKMQTSSSVVLISCFPYAAWRLLIDYLWGDETFMYRVIPRFRNDFYVTLLLLSNGGPTRKASTAFQARRRALEAGPRPGRCDHTGEAITQKSERVGRSVAGFDGSRDREVAPPRFPSLVIYAECEPR